MNKRQRKKQQCKNNMWVNLVFPRRHGHGKVKMRFCVLDGRIEMGFSQFAKHTYYPREYQYHQTRSMMTMEASK
jgi:hypothetical protein